MSRPSNSWQDTLANLQALGTDDGVAVGQSAIVTGATPGVYECATAAATTSTWTVLASTSAGTLAATLVVGNTSGGTDIVVSGGDSIESASGRLELDSNANGVHTSDSFWADVSVATMGAAVSNAPVGAEGVVIGDGVGNEGLTVYTGAGSVGRLVFTDSSGSEVASFRYSHSSQRFEVLVEGVQTAQFEDGGDFNILKDFSAVDGTFTGNATLDSASPVLFIGDGTSSPTVRIDKGASADSGIRFLAAGINRHIVTLASDESLRFTAYDAAGANPITGLRLEPVTCDVTIATNVDIMSGTLDVGGLATFTGAVMLDSASPTLTVGDGTGGPDLIIDKLGANEGEIRWQSGGALDWITRNDTSENYTLRRYVAGAFQDVPIIVSNADGNITFANDISAVDGMFTGIVDMQGSYCDLPRNSGAPAAVAGRMYYDTSDGITYIYDGSAASWKALYA